MFTNLARGAWKPAVVVAVVALALSGTALAYAFTVVFGTSGNDTINESGRAGNFHIYGFQGSDNLTGGNGNITIVSGKPVINGYDLIYGDGSCTQTPPGNDSYCSHPAPWLPQPWTDTAGSNDNITGGVGPDWLIGGGGNNTITGSKTYDVIVGGGPSDLAGGTTVRNPNVNNIVGGLLGSAIIAIQPTDVSTITLKKTTGMVGYDGLVGVPNVVDVYVPNRSSTLGPNTINCASKSNLDLVFANKNDVVNNCFLVIRGAAPVFPGQFATPSVSSSSTPSFTFPPGLGVAPYARDNGRTHKKVTTHRKLTKHTTAEHSKKHAARH